MTREPGALRAPRGLVADGALGTALEAIGLTLPPPAWSAHAVAHAPDRVAAVHRAYAEAGATVHTAATFRTTPQGVGARATALTRAAVALAREAVPGDHAVLGSLAPVADCWAPGSSPPDAAAHHRDQIARLVDAGVDGLLLETFAHVEECVAATEIAARTGLPVWASLTPGFRGDLLPPDDVASGARRLAEAGADVVLVNCLPARRAGPWVEAVASAGVPWGILANAGPPQDGLQAVADPSRPGHGHLPADARAAWRACAAGWIQRGAHVVGGCCATLAPHVREVATLMTARR